MVRGQEIRNANKNVLDWGAWQVGGMQTAAFPLSKRQRRSYRLGTAYRWRVVRFEATTAAQVTICRLLVAYSAAKEQFRATLAVENQGDMSVIALLRISWHASRLAYARRMRRYCQDSGRLNARRMATARPDASRVAPSHQLRNFQ